MIQADEAEQYEDHQYPNAISAATSIQTHVSKQVYFNPVQQMSNIMEYKTQSSVFNNCQVTFHMAGSSAGTVPYSDKRTDTEKFVESQTGLLPSTSVKIGSLKLVFMLIILFFVETLIVCEHN